MGCLRLIGAFIGFLFVATVLTLVGAIFGGVISAFAAGGNFSGFGSEVFSGSNTGVDIGAGIGALLGLIIGVSLIRRALQINWLKQHGVRVGATVTEIKQQSQMQQVPYTTSEFRGGRSVMVTKYRTEWRTVYYVTAQWMNPTTSQVYTFKSSALLSFPRKYPEGSIINVLIDPNDAGKYYMEF